MVLLLQGDAVELNVIVSDRSQTGKDLGKRRHNQIFTMSEKVNKISLLNSRNKMDFFFIFTKKEGI